MDVVLMAVKTLDLEAACTAIQPLMGPETFVVPLLNGADIAERIGDVIGLERVLGGTTFASSNLIAPGRARHVANAILHFGELGGDLSARGDALRAIFENAGLITEHSDDIRREVWEKFILVSPMAGVSSVIRLPTRFIASIPEIRTLYEEAAQEVTAVARAAGIVVAEDIVARVLSFIDKLPPRHTVSTLLDLRARRRLEPDAMVGTVVRMGAELGVQTPTGCSTTPSSPMRMAHPRNNQFRAVFPF
ncbi:MAG: 2-dehydropantoate 2-reductase [SAR324 cluster bacterium]|nr:2-dehydropantoate 2-reductase [SAR324 cluster bacterium]